MQATESDDDQAMKKPVADNSVAHTQSFEKAVAFFEKVLVSDGGLYLFSGANQIGKSTVLKHIEGTADERFVVILSSIRHIDIDSLSNLLNRVFAINQTDSQDSHALALRYFLKLGTIQSKGKRFVLLLDDVEAIHTSGADLLKAMLKMKNDSGQLLTVVLCGDHQLTEVMDQSYRWGIQKYIRGSHTMTAIDATQTAVLADNYAIAQGARSIPFTATAKATLHRLAHGVPGTILKLADHASNIAQQQGSRHITASMIKAAVTGKYLSFTQRLTSVGAKAAVALVILLLIPTILIERGFFEQDSDEQVPADQFTMDTTNESLPEAGLDDGDRSTGPAVTLTEDTIAVLVSGDIAVTSKSTIAGIETDAIDSVASTNIAATQSVSNDLGANIKEPTIQPTLSMFNLSIPNVVQAPESVTTSPDATEGIVVTSIPAVGLQYMDPTFIKDIPNTRNAYRWMYRGFIQQIPKLTGST